MAEEIIDLRDRIEQMRIQIENEAVEQISKEAPLEIHQQTSNSNISLSMEKNNKDYANQNNNKEFDSKKFYNQKDIIFTFLLFSFIKISIFLLRRLILMLSV